jgi:hypothetical protein
MTLQEQVTDVENRISTLINDIKSGKYHNRNEAARIDKESLDRQLTSLKRKIAIIETREFADSIGFSDAVNSYLDKLCQVDAFARSKKCPEIFDQFGNLLDIAVSPAGELTILYRYKTKTGPL